MSFEVVDMKNWSRKEHFEHYVSNIPCTYSMTVKLDITQIKRRQQKLYPTMIYYIATIVNRHPEFRTAINEKDEVVIFDEIHPSYTVFHKNTETFSTIWTEYDSDYETFCASYEQDILEYGNREGLFVKANIPENNFPVSMIPWTTFEGFHLNLQKGYHYLLPIFTMGKYYEENSTFLLPLAIQVHHAVCDGFHLCRFVNELQELINQNPDQPSV